MKKRNLVVTFVLTALLSLSLSWWRPAHVFAATFSVNSVLDASDNIPGDGLCDDGLGHCTLRAAIEETNSLGGTNTINFAIAGSGVHTFTPASDLPQITGPLTIDATTQSGSSCGTLVPASLPASSNTQHTLKIQIDAAAVSKGLDIGSDNVTIKGFVINSASTQQIYIATDNNTIECNYLGTNVAGNDVGSATSGGLYDQGTNGNVVQNNLISANSYGISTSSHATVQNNLIGTTANGLAALPNDNNGVSANGSTIIKHNVIAASTSAAGIGTFGSSGASITGNLVGLNLAGSPLGNHGDGISLFSGSNITVGGATASDRNVIAANNGNGIHIYSNCNGSGAYSSTVIGNYIGTKTDGTISEGYGNQRAGIEVNEYNGSCGTIYKQLIGGDAAGQANVIAGNTNEGILVHQDVNHDVFSVSILTNSIFGNGSIGIDLAADSGSDGDVDTDQGPNSINDLLMSYPTQVSNYYINHPVVNTASLSGNQLAVNYDFNANAVLDSEDGTSLRTTDLAGYRLDFYVNDTATDGLYEGYSQGSRHIGSFIVDGSTSGASHTFTTGLTLSAGQTVNATATVLWKVIDEPSGGGCGERRVGNGPPYSLQDGCG